MSDIKEPLPEIRDLWARYAYPTAIKNSLPNMNSFQIITREAALTLAELHPLIVTEKKHHCLCNQRILEILTTRLNPDDRIPVGIVPVKTASKLIHQYVLTDILTSALVFAPLMPTKDIFNLSESLPVELINQISPALTQNISTRATILGTVTGTLYKWMKEIKSTSPR